MLIPTRSVRFIEDPPAYFEQRRTGPLLLAHLRGSYTFEPVRSGAFEGFRLVPH